MEEQSGQTSNYNIIDGGGGGEGGTYLQVSTKAVDKENGEMMIGLGKTNWHTSSLSCLLLVMGGMGKSGEQGIYISWYWWMKWAVNKNLIVTLITSDGWNGQVRGVGYLRIKILMNEMGGQQKPHCHANYGCNGLVRNLSCCWWIGAMGLSETCCHAVDGRNVQTKKIIIILIKSCQKTNKQKKGQKTLHGHDIVQANKNINIVIPDSNTLIKSCC